MKYLISGITVTQKILWVVIALCLILVGISAQADWEETFGGTGDDGGHCVQQVATLSPGIQNLSELAGKMFTSSKRMLMETSSGKKLRWRKR